MSVTFSTPFKTIEEAQKMKSFFENNTDILDKLRVNSYCNAKHNIEFKFGNELPYTPENIDNLLGFNESEMTDYQWDLICWMAIKSNNQEGDNAGIIFYDNEKIAINFKIGDDVLENIFVDENGIRPLKQKTGLKKILSNILLGDNHIQQKIIMKDLDNKWNAYNLPNKSKFKINYNYYI